MLQPAMGGLLGPVTGLSPVSRVVNVPGLFRGQEGWCS